MRGRTTATRLLNKILASEWAIRPEWLSQVAGIATRLGEDGAAPLTAESIREEIRGALADLGNGSFDSVTMEMGEPLAERSRAVVRNSVAVIPVIGPLFHYATAFDDVCGCSSYEQIALDVGVVRDAYRMGRVQAAILEVDSPGGEVGGVAETADLIAALSEEMPVVGYSPDLAASAAYWLISATSHVIVSQTALLGSIGVVATFRSGHRSNVIEIVSSQSPKKRPDVETEEGRAQVQATVDALAEVFLEPAAFNRGVPLEAARTQFGQGDVLVGLEAVHAELADELGSFERVLQDLAAGQQFVPRRGTDPNPQSRRVA